MGPDQLSGVQVNSKTWKQCSDTLDLMVCYKGCSANLALLRASFSL
jgi:hypothetical protein